MEQGAALHDACRSRRQGRGSLSRIHRAQRPTSFAVSSRLVKTPIKLLQPDRSRRSANTDFPSRLPCYSRDREPRFRIRLPPAASLARTLRQGWYGDDKPNLQQPLGAITNAFPEIAQMRD